MTDELPPKKKMGPKPKLPDTLALKGNGKKGAFLMQPGTIAPRNEVENLFLATYGTVTPIPPETHRRGQAYITAAILYIHQNQQIGEIATITDRCYELLCRVRTEDRWDQFKQQLMQAARPSCLALVEHLDIERINQERERRLSTLDDLISCEEKIMKALPNMSPGSLVQSTALANVEKLRKIVASTIGLDAHSVEQHAGRRVGITKAVERLMNSETPVQSKDDGSILDV